MARTGFNVATENPHTPSINGEFSVNVGRTSFPDKKAEGPQHYIVGGQRIATSNPYWDGTTVKWTAEIDGITYSYNGTYSRGSSTPFSGTVSWPSPEAGEDSWQAGVGEPEEVEERSATA